jgi:putative ABC transport system ATP-binding protein
LVVGPSGCGKSTLLNLLAGLTAVQSGTLDVLGTAFAKLDAAARDQFRARNVALVPQRLHLVSAVDVQHNLALAMSLAGREPNRTEITDALATLGVASRARAMPATLSVGEAQRVAIARALLVRPKLLLADEPTSALDDHNTDRMVRLLTDAASRATATLVVVTHDQRLTGLLPTSLALTGARVQPA